MVQPSPFCNLDCDYCYLPSRDDSRRMEFGTLQALLFKIFQAGLPSPRLSVVWHAGEPTAVPRDWYERAFALIQRYRSRDVALTHHFQSNGVLIDDQAPTASSNNVNINGGGTVELDGAMYFPNVGVTWGGNVQNTNTGCTEVVAKTLTINGNAYLDSRDCVPATQSKTQVVALVQ